MALIDVRAVLSEKTNLDFLALACKSGTVALVDKLLKDGGFVFDRDALQSSGKNDPFLLTIGDLAEDPDHCCMTNPQIWQERLTILNMLASSPKIHGNKFDSATWHYCPKEGDHSWFVFACWADAVNVVEKVLASPDFSFISPRCPGLRQLVDYGSGSEYTLLPTFMSDRIFEALLRSPKVVGSPPLRDKDGANLFSQLVLSRTSEIDDFRCRKEWIDRILSDDGLCRALVDTTPPTNDSHKDAEISGDDDEEEEDLPLFVAITGKCFSLAKQFLQHHCFRPDLVDGEAACAAVVRIELDMEEGEAPDILEHLEVLKLLLSGGYCRAPFQTANILKDFCINFLEPVSKHIEQCNSGAELGSEDISLKAAAEIHTHNIALLKQLLARTAKSALAGADGTAVIAAAIALPEPQSRDVIAAFQEAENFELSDHLSKELVLKIVDRNWERFAKLVAEDPALMLSGGKPTK